MLNTTLTSSACVLALLGGSALAQPARPAAPAPATPVTAARAVQVSVGIKLGNDARTYDLLVEPDRCGEVEAQDASRRDEVEVCVDAQPGGLWIKAVWKLRAGAIGYKTNATAVIAPGRTIDVGRAGGPRFTLTAM